MKRSRIISWLNAAADITVLTLLAVLVIVCVLVAMLAYAILSAARWGITWAARVMPMKEEEETDAGR